MRKIWDDMAERLPSPEKEVCMISAGPLQLGAAAPPGPQPPPNGGGLFAGAGVRPGWELQFSAPLVFQKLLSLVTQDNTGTSVFQSLESSGVLVGASGLLPVCATHR